MAKQINCGICAYHGDTVAMKLVQDHFECPQCEATTYDTDTGDDRFIRLFRQQQKEYISRSFQPGTHISGGGEGTGKPKTEKMKCKTLARVNFDMDSPRLY